MLSLSTDCIYIALYSCYLHYYTSQIVCCDHFITVLWVGKQAQDFSDWLTSYSNLIEEMTRQLEQSGVYYRACIYCFVFWSCALSTI